MVAAPARPNPVRTCVACRTRRDRWELMRVVRAPDGPVTIDPSGRLEGRGAYLCRDGACWEKALRRGSLERALGVTLPGQVRAALERSEPGSVAAPVAAPRPDGHQAAASVQGGIHGA